MIFCSRHQLLHLCIGLRGVTGRLSNQFAGAAAAHRAGLYLGGDGRHVCYQSFDGARLLYCALRESLRTRCYAVRAGINLVGDMGNIPNHVYKICARREGTDGRGARHRLLR